MFFPLEGKGAEIPRVGQPLACQEHTLIHFFGGGRGHARVCSQIYLL